MTLGPARLLPAQEIARRVDGVAAQIAPRIDDETVLVCLLIGGLWFAADLSRALAQRGRHTLFDALWLASYGDAKESAGAAVVRADLQRPIEGRRVLIVDDVLDSGVSLETARRIVRAGGATEVLTAVFARKPWPSPRAVEPDFVAWDAPARFLIGYGMDFAGRYRGLDGIDALD